MDSKDNLAQHHWTLSRVDGILVIPGSPRYSGLLVSLCLHCQSKKPAVDRKGAFMLSEQKKNEFVLSVALGEQG